VHESVLLCLAELFTPATRQLASAAQVHLRLAAELLVKPDDLVDEEGASTLPCQLALHLMGPAGERAPGTLAIARILVALSEHLSASCHHELLDSEVMQALMVAVAKPVGKHACSGVLCALAVFHLMMASPGLLLAALGKGSELVPSLCALMQHVVVGAAPTASGRKPSTNPLQVLPSDCVCTLLHVAHMRPWLQYPSLHQERVSKLILQRICESKAVACLVSYMELEAASLQNASDELAACTEAELEAAVERNEQQISVTVKELEAARQGLEHYRQEVHSMKHLKASHHGLPSAALEHLERAQEGKAAIKQQAHALKQALSSLYYQRRVLGKQLKALVPRLQQLKGHSQFKAARAQRHLPNCDVLLQAISTLAQLASPLATANKGPDPELEHLQASIQQQMLKSDLLAVSLGLATTLAGLEQLVHLKKSLLKGLGILEDTAAELNAAAMLIQSHLTRLENVKMRISFEIKQAEGELQRMTKARAFGFPRGKPSFSVPLTSENTLCTGICLKDLMKRESRMQGELGRLVSLASTLASTMDALEQHLKQVQELQAALAALTSKKAKFQPSPRGPVPPSNSFHLHHSSQAAWDGQEIQAQQHTYGPLLSSLSSHLHPMAFPERAVDRLHDLLLPPFLTTTAPEHTTNLTATSPASSRPSSAAAPLRRIGDTGRDQQQHQGQYQAQQFKMKHAAHAPNFNSHEGLTALQSSSPAHSMPASPRARPASPKARPASAQAALHLNPKARSGVDASYEDLGPDMSKADASQRAMRLLDAVHSSLSSSQLLSSKAGQEEHEMSHSQRPPIDVDALCQQSSDLESTIASLSALASKAHALSISARMLPTYCTSAITKADALGTLLEPLMANFAWCLEHQRDKSGCAVAYSVAHIAKKGLTKSADYASVFVNTGILDALTLQLYSECGSNPPANSRAQSPSQQQGGSPKEVSRYTLVVPTLRPSGPGIARRAAAAAALLEVGQVHLEALDSVAGDEEAIPSLCDLVLDCSVDIAARLSAAALIAATVSLRTDDSAELSLRKGAFTALMFVMDSDHRQGSTNAKGWVIAALAAICLNEGLRCLIPDLLHSRGDGMGMGSPQLKASKHAVAAQKLKDAFVLQTDEQVQVAILHTLWGVPLQLVALLSTDAAKGGR